MPENCDSKRATRAGTVIANSRAWGTRRKSASRTTTGSFAAGASGGCDAAAAAVATIARVTSTNNQRDRLVESVTDEGGSQEHP